MRATLRVSPAKLAFRCVFVLAAALDCGGSSAEELITSPLASEFGGGPWLDSISIAPDGSKVVAVVKPASGGVRVDVIDIEARTSKTIYDEVSVVDGKTLRSCIWAKQTFIVCQQAEAGAPIRFYDRRLVRVRDDGSLGHIALGELYNLLPQSPTDVLIRGQGPKASGYGLFRLNLETLASPTSNTIPLLADESGEMRIRRHSIDVVSELVSEWQVRPTRDSDWVARPVSEVTPGTRPMGMLEGSNEVVFVATRGQRVEVLAYDLVTRRRRVVLTDAHDNVVNVRLLGATRRPVGAEVFDGTDRVLFFEPRMVEVQAMAGRALGQPGFVDVVEEDFARRFYVVSARGRHYRLDSRDGTVSEIPFLPPPKRSVDRVPVEYRAPDGREIHGHLSMPPNRTRPVPAVIVPSLNARAAQPQHHLVSFLVEKGYAVFEASYPSWLQRDSTTGSSPAVVDVGVIAASLVASGVAQPNRLCALGWEAGGLTALLAAVEDGTQLKCVVAYAPIATQYVSAAASSLRAPVLVFYPSSDPLVDLGEMPKLRRAVRAAGGSIEVVRYQDVSQALEEPSMRIDAFARTAVFLEQHLGR